MKAAFTAWQQLQNKANEEKQDAPITAWKYSTIPKADSSPKTADKPSAAKAAVAPTTPTAKSVTASNAVSSQ